MQYKTIILELLQQNPELKASLLHSNSLTSILDYYAIQLRESHLAIMHQMQSQQPQLSELMISSEAMEIAIQELQDSLNTGQTASESEPLSLDQAMEFVKRHTPHE